MGGDDLYKYIDTWNGNTLFIYITISLFILWYMSKKNIDLKVTVIVITFIISYLNHHSITTIDTEKDIQNLKKEFIKPQLLNTSEKNVVIDFVYSIQDIYIYNPLQYENMIKYIDNFFKLYKLSFINTKSSHLNYNHMKTDKRSALNALKSIIFNSPNDTNIRNKINNAAFTLDKILTEYLDQISYLIDNDIYINGYNMETTIIDYDTKPYNEYTDIFKPYSYELY